VPAVSPEAAVTAEPSPPPIAPAWFCHRRGRERRLGVALPENGVTFVDVGPANELEALSRGGLRGEDLPALARHGTVLAGVPDFDVPVARPSKVLCLGKNYAAHAAELGGTVPEEPFAFAKLADALVPHGADVVIPYWLDSRVDHEIELAVVLGFDDLDGRGRKYVEESRAPDLVAGYTIFNDVTARALQKQDVDQRRPWLRAKGFDTFGPFGPWVVPAASLHNPDDLAIELRVNGELRQQSRTSHMVVSVARAIAYLSRHTTLRPGDVIAMGTPAGVGPVQPGDVMRGEIAGIGALVNRVRREERVPASSPVPDVLPGPD
jgi:2-keto-4-pentenoate hydratase/2-oxohepta-3-ene-1,7-dioic acid hydratase in catechol pathway